MRNLLNRLILISAFATPGFAQLSLIDLLSKPDLAELHKAHSDLYSVTEQYWCIIGSTQGTALSRPLKLLDANFDPAMSYFVLYPLRSHRSCDIAQFGTILFECDQFIIYRTTHEFLREFREFDPFEIARITTGNVLPPLETHGQKSLPAPIPNDAVRELIGQVNQDSLWINLEKLTKMQRYSRAAATTTTAENLRDIFINSYKTFSSVTLQSIGAGYSPNIVAVKNGADTPDSLFIGCAHYDVYANNAPGADDNGSGAVIVMEAARVLSRCTFKKSIVFILFSAEEAGMIGSAKYAAQAVTERLKIGGATNVDVAGYRWDKKPRIEIAYDDPSKALYQNYLALVTAYLPAIPTYDGFSSRYKSQSDNKSFWNKGFKCLITNGELDPAHINSAMHTMNDVIGTSANCKEELLAVAQGMVAALATWAELKTDVRTVALTHNQPQAFHARYSTAAKSIVISGGTGTIRLFSSNGKEITPRTAVRSSAAGSMDVSDLANGVYIVRAGQGVGAMARTIHIAR